MSANVVSELQELALSRPALDAPGVAVAFWYLRKARVLDHLGRREAALQAAGHARLLFAPATPAAGRSFVGVAA